MKFLTLSLIFLSFVCCTKQKDSEALKEGRTPEDTIRAFIDVSSGAKDLNSREELKKLCIGELRRAIDRMSDEIFQLSYMDARIKVLDLKILEKNIKKDTAVIRYRLSVENLQGDDSTRYLSEREVELIRSQGKWYIEYIRSSGSDKIAFTRGMIF